LIRSRGVSDLPHKVPEKYDENFLAAMDGRAKVTKELRERLTTLQNDLGGEDALSYQRRSLCKRAIWLEAIVEGKEVKIAKGNIEELSAYVQAVNSLIGLYRALGLDRVARDVPHLRDYIDHQSA
jgi:hypothetical protein